MHSSVWVVKKEPEARHHSPIGVSPNAPLDDFEGGRATEIMVVNHCPDSMTGRCDTNVTSEDPQPVAERQERRLRWLRNVRW